MTARGVIPRENTGSLPANEYRKALLKGLPVTENTLPLAGISTSLLTGGRGPGLILLHGPAESACWWMGLIPTLVTRYRVIIPDLPGHGGSQARQDDLSPARIFCWLSELIDQTCKEPPALAGHVLGGAIAARFAIDHGKKLRCLVLADSLGLGKFSPTLRYAFGLIRYMFPSTGENAQEFLPQYFYSKKPLKDRLGGKWDAFIDYHAACARDPDQKSAVQILMKTLGIPVIPREELARISIPTVLILGRHDRASRRQAAEAVSTNFHWPLYILEGSRDDPKLTRPGKFADLLQHILASIPSR